MEIIVATLSILYLGAGVAANLAYLPTIRALWKMEPAANLQSYVIWVFTSGIVSAYAIVVNGDRLFIALSCFGFFCCALVLALEIRRLRAQLQPCERKDVEATGGKGA